MNELHTYTWVGWTHLTSALLAMVLGVWVLLRRKGDRFHIRLGYAYVSCMLVLNGTAFGLHRLMGFFGPFHVAALVSLATLLAGMRAVLRKPRRKDWLVQHLTYMYWSVIGLYAAFFSELMVRLPLGATFAWSVGAATAATIFLGFFLQGRLTKRWTAMPNRVDA
ncbi:MAG TPA: DUF2306 domain-containing protein [Flavobacteriales bacterium]